MSWYKSLLANTLVLLCLPDPPGVVPNEELLCKNYPEASIPTFY